MITIIFRLENKFDVASLEIIRVLMWKHSFRLFRTINSLRISPTSSKRIRSTLEKATFTAIGVLLYHSLAPSKVELGSDYFTKYRISKKKTIDEDHFFLELSPLIPQKVNLWSTFGSSKLWSVQIKQPEIMVVRNYTPLPLKLNDDDEIEVLKDGENCDGRLLFYIKQYNNGEVARWLHNLPVGQVVELRGPYVDYEFPNAESDTKRSREFLWKSTESSETEKFRYQPFDLSMFTAGTGIVTALQLLLTESPFRGEILLFHSCREKSELGPLLPLLKRLQEHDRVKLYLFESSKGCDIRQQIKNVKEMIPEPSEYVPNLPFLKPGSDTIIKPVLSLVCGPDSYISTIAGDKYDLSQGPIKGLLGEKGWTNSNVYKLS